jgi:exodeoxyribonuclease VII large subunit
MQQKGLEFDAPPAEASPRRALTVSELTLRIAGILETEFLDVWVEGEVSNLKAPESGHLYFSLKDEKAQLRAVVWRGDARLLRFRPKDGMKVLARGSVRVYAPRGEYQISVQAMEPLGKGSLQLAFEERKERLQREGLFDASRKRPLPLLPRRIGVVTSPTGAVIRDIVRVLASRYANLGVLVYPARVQGAEAADEIAQGIRVLNRVGGLDVLMVARGGGSIEDLWAFNEEVVARALAASAIPTLSAVGHETDFTIADFVADRRAPTPSAAAEMVVQAKVDLLARVDALTGRLGAAQRLRLERVRSRLRAATTSAIFTAERRRLQTLAQRVDELAGRSRAALARRAERANDRMLRTDGRLAAFRLDRQLALRAERLGRGRERLSAAMRLRLGVQQGALAAALGQLESLSPLAVLARGYALVWAKAGDLLVRSPDQVDLGAALRVRLHGGVLEATVTAKENP